VERRKGRGGKDIVGFGRESARLSAAERRSRKGRTDPVRHEKEGVVDIDSTRLDLSDDDGSEVVVLLRDGEHDGSVDVSVRRSHGVEEVEEGGRAEVCEGRRVKDDKGRTKGKTAISV
jgi:hypothetical protein